MKNTANKENKALKIILKILKYTGLITLSLFSYNPGTGSY